MKTKQLNTKNTQSVGETIRELRINHHLPLRKVAAQLDIDQSYLSKIERGEKMATKEQVIRLATIFNVNKDDLLLKFLSDKIVYEIKNEELAHEAIKVAEKKIKYNMK